MREATCCVVLLFGVIQGCQAQKMKKVCGEYTYYAPHDITLEQAKFTALDRAKVNAIAEEFGTIISQSNTTLLTNSNEKSSSEFMSLSESDVKGEWLETIGEPDYTISYEGDMLVVTVRVSGKIREIKSAAINLSAKILCNGTADQHERYEFKDGDDMYLKFQSSVDGFLTVYLVVPVESMAYCLLPYSNSSESAVKIERDKSYVFFSQDKVAAGQKGEVDEYTLTCKGNMERNDIYLLFSPNPYAKASGEKKEGLIPRSLLWKDFQKWMVKSRTRDNEMQLIHYILKITKL